MAVQKSRMFFLLFVISTSIVLFVLSSGNISQNISWTVLSGKFIHRHGESNITYLDDKGNSTPSPAVLPTTNKTKITVSVTTNPVTEFKTDVMRTSTNATVAETPMPVLSKNAFKTLPKWDFEDKYNEDAPPRQTTCAQSLRKSEDESFKKAFLPNIRLFMHKDNINMSEWNRLSHFNNPFGFMGYRYDDVMASAKFIPKPKEPLLLPGSDGCVRCAVVGTSGILYGSKLGKEIDAHDYVFRMNGAVIQGFEEDVGNKTSVYVHTAHSINSASYTLKKYGFKSIPHDEGIKYVMIPEGMRDFQWLQGLLKGERVSAGPYHNKRPRTYYAQQYNETRFYVLHQDFLRYVRNRFLSSHILNSRNWAIVRPTNGAFTLFLALQTCDTVDAYGFITDDHKKYSNYYYERNAKTHVVYYINHDYSLEMNTWKRLYNSKIMKLYQRPDPETEKPKQ